MPGGNRPKRGRPGKRKRQSKYSGKALNAELQDALGGVTSKPDASLFFEEKDPSLELPRRDRVRLEARKAEAAAETAPVVESATDVALLKKRARGGKAVAPAKKKNTGARDLWADESVQVTSKRLLRSHMHRPSTKHQVEAVKVAHPGTSYMPRPTDMKAGLEATVAEIAKVNAAKAKVNAPTEPMIAHAKRRAAQARGNEEEEKQDSESESESGSGSDSESEAEAEAESEAGAEPTEKGPVSAVAKRRLAPGERITTAERNRAKRRKKEERRQAARARHKQLMKDIDEAPKTVEEIEAKLAREHERAEQRKLKRKAELLQEPVPRFNGRRQQYAPEIQAVLPSDLSSNMRRMKPHGGALLARFQSLHTRNAMDIGETNRRLAKRKKARVKHVPVGKPFMVEDYDHSDGPKRKKRYMKHGKVAIPKS